jgi:hypothetical protein
MPKRPKFQRPRFFALPNSQPEEAAISARTSGRRKLGYICPRCAARAWGKPDLHLRCDDCDRPMDLIAPAAELIERRLSR